MAGIMANTKLTVNNPPMELLVSKCLLSFSDIVCICRNISSPEKCRLLFNICNQSFNGILTIGISIAHIIHLLFFIGVKLVLKSFEKSKIHIQLDNPNIKIEPMACMHNSPECV